MNENNSKISNIDLKNETHSQDENKYLERKKRIQNLLRNREDHSTSYKKITRYDESFSIANRIKARYNELKNEDFKQNIILKRRTLFALFIFLAVETVFIFYYAWCQATKWYGFELEEWSFRLLTGATITQITVMLSIAIEHLFPKKK